MLRASFAEPEALAALNKGEVTDLTDALASLGDMKAYGLLSVWMSASPAWQSLDPSDLGRFAQGLAADGEAAKPQRSRGGARGEEAPSHSRGGARP